MTQAKVLTQEEVERVLQYLGKKQHAMRNQCMFLLTHGCGVRIKELVSMRICDVMDRNGQINQEVHLNRTQTKGDRGRTVYLSDKMRELVRNYLCERFGLQDLMVVTMTNTSRALFTNQKMQIVGFHRQLVAKCFTTGTKIVTLFTAAVTVVVARSLQTWRTKAWQYMC